MGRGGGGTFLPQSRQEAPCLPHRIRVGAETDTVTNVPQPAWSRGAEGGSQAALPHGGACV